MNSDKRRVGNLGEDLACEHLKKQGFSVVCRNYWRKWGEIDVVAQKGNDLRFVEVKTVTRHKLSHVGGQARQVEEDYEPEDNLHPWKRKRLRRVIETYLVSQNVPDDIDWQVDAITVYLNKEGTALKIEHLEDIVL